jgi:intracellular septation protein
MMLDFLPLVTFFIGFKLAGIALATALMVGFTCVSLTAIYLMEKRIALLPLISGVCVLVFGSLTLLFDSELFIKLRPTIVNTLFAMILLVGAYGFKQGWLKYVMGFAFHVSDACWLILSKRWACLFLGLACLNELVWRNFSTDTWVNIKVFGFIGITLVFSMAQLPLMERMKLPENESVE